MFAEKSTFANFISIDCSCLTEQSLGIQMRPQTLNAEYESRTIENRIERLTFCIILAPKLERLVGRLFFDCLCSVFVEMSEGCSCRGAALQPQEHFSTAVCRSCKGGGTKHGIGKTCSWFHYTS